MDRLPLKQLCLLSYGFYFANTNSNNEHILYFKIKNVFNWIEEVKILSFRLMCACIVVILFPSTDKCDYSASQHSSILLPKDLDKSISSFLRSKLSIWFQDVVGPGTSESVHVKCVQGWISDNDWCIGGHFWQTVS